MVFTSLSGISNSFDILVTMSCSLFKYFVLTAFLKIPHFLITRISCRQTISRLLLKFPNPNTPEEYPNLPLLQRTPRGNLPIILPAHLWLSLGRLRHFPESGSIGIFSPISRLLIELCS